MAYAIYGFCIGGRGDTEAGQTWSDMDFTGKEGCLIGGVWEERAERSAIRAVERTEVFDLAELASAAAVPEDDSGGRVRGCHRRCPYAIYATRPLRPSRCAPADAYDWQDVFGGKK